MKKIIIAFLSIALMFSLAACGGNGNQNSTESSSQPDSSTTPEVSTTPGTPSETTEPPTDASEETPSVETTGGKVLVVYYSASGNTEAVAKTVADAAGGDLFELVPVNPYTSDDLDWTNQDSRVSREHNDESLRVVELEKAVPDNWEDYDTVFIGYPIWWAIAAWPVDGFISANDFSGKTVIPFCTSASSELGQSGELLAESAGEGNWQEGQRFSSHPSDETVREWVNSLGLN